MINWFQHLIDAAGYAGVFLLLFIENIFPPLPSEIVAPFCGFAAARGELGLPGVIVAAVLDRWRGKCHGITPGRFLGEKRIEALAARYGRWMTVTPRETRPCLRLVQPHGAASVFFGRMIPAIRAVISLPAGIAEMPLPRFLAYSLARHDHLDGRSGLCRLPAWPELRTGREVYRAGHQIVVAVVVAVYVVRLARSFRKPETH